VFAQAIAKFLAYFYHPTLSGIGMALLFGLIWLLLYRPPMFKKPVLWLALLGGTLTTLLASAFIQQPLVNLLGRNLARSPMLLAGLILALLGGLVQEGAKLLPVFLLWRREGRKLNPNLGLLAGAAAGIGFGILEAQWVHNALFASGWNWDLLRNASAPAMLTFWERFCMLGLHAGLTALAGYGLAKDKGWSYYLLAALLHALASYLAYLLAGGVLSILMMELVLTVLVVVLTVVMVSERGENLTKVDNS
jgi:RsiW-degrading membrane proteinase PrsW (M82 family)